ncbi:LysM peptidoglycan-binding domain-containing protein [Paenibacillus sp. SYP-B3998]|uniref:LysM peptidoglycan-binding domain-containing protein n=1 Tax=Paenibacillus sp. SYP-B3998 TaxID=2678564 RepID=A0A6G4A5Z9_9BACL|nr:CAP domain-containing protein [Paenibacillus sp. SYP-B3998]NEW09750.1 LysM peptidoglycan-binding domain-containing protein [Paenibacillus sp. SYP-B3998]
MHFKKTALSSLLILGMVAYAGAANASAASYTVKGQDTMWSISQKQGIALSALIRQNPQVTNPNNIWPGMILQVPGNTLTNTAPAISQATYADQVISLVNQERTNAGLKPLATDKSLSAMALDKAKDMYNNHYFDHTSPTFGSPFNMMTSYGIQYSYAGENIAMGQQTPQAVMNAWMNSTGHRQNILSPNYTKIGVGYYNNEWVQEFIAN